MLEIWHRLVTTINLFATKILANLTKAFQYFIYSIYTCTCTCTCMYDYVFCKRTNPLRMQHRNHILYLVEEFRTVILVGETGSGKTTQVRSSIA